jgi:hypothetical protein
MDGWMDDCWNMKLDIPLVDGWMDGWMLEYEIGYSFFYAVNNTTVDRHKEYNSLNEKLL